MWTRQLMGSDVYHLVCAFIIYSVMGWGVESIYMSWCNRRLTNRGFGYGPWCPIYGFGGVVGHFILAPLREHIVALYIVGAIVATTFELLVGFLMQRVFHEVWWDYNDKPFNYKGIICLESTVAWGFYAVIIICFLNSRIVSFIDSRDMAWGILACRIVIVTFIVDYVFTLRRILRENDIDLLERGEQVLNSIKELVGR